jgi:type IV pilus assembly protein PilB
MTPPELPRRTNRLPGNPNIEQLKNQAKDILLAHKSGDQPCAAINGLAVSGEEDPVLDFVNKMSKDALIMSAAQILFEPYEFNCRVRYRIDGALHSVKVTKSKTIEFRIDAQPMAFGEKINLSILDTSAVKVGFEALGLDVTQIQIIRRSMQQLRGLVLFAGPREQGRTVTMLTSVNELNTPANEINSAE